MFDGFKKKSEIKRKCFFFLVVFGVGFFFCWFLDWILILKLYNRSNHFGECIKIWWMNEFHAKFNECNKCMNHWTYTKNVCLFSLKRKIWLQFTSFNPVIFLNVYFFMFVHSIIPIYILYILMSMFVCVFLCVRLCMQMWWMLLVFVFIVRFFLFLLQ